MQVSSTAEGEAFAFHTRLLGEHRQTSVAEQPSQLLLLETRLVSPSFEGQLRIIRRSPSVHIVRLDNPAPRT